MRGAVLLASDEAVYDGLQQLGLSSYEVRRKLSFGIPEGDLTVYGVDPYGRATAWTAVQRLLSAFGVADAALPFLFRWEEDWMRQRYRFAFRSDDVATRMPKWERGAIPVNYEVEYDDHDNLAQFNACFPAAVVTISSNVDRRVRRRVLALDA